MGNYCIELMGNLEEMFPQYYMHCEVCNISIVCYPSRKGYNVGSLRQTIDMLLHPAVSPQTT